MPRSFQVFSGSIACSWKDKHAQHDLIVVARTKKRVLELVNEKFPCSLTPGQLNNYWYLKTREKNALEKLAEQREGVWISRYMGRDYEEVK